MQLTVFLTSKDTPLFKIKMGMSNEFASLDGTVNEKKENTSISNASLIPSSKSALGSAIYLNGNNHTVAIETRIMNMISGASIA